MSGDMPLEARNHVKSRRGRDASDTSRPRHKAAYSMSSRQVAPR